MTANTVLTTNFNVTPYYDDYDSNKNFYRILFKPGYAVQSRELTQMQTILQNQVKRFGQHVFKEGSIVIPGAISVETNSGLSYVGKATAYIKIKDVDSLGNSVTPSDFIGQEIIGVTNGVKAQVIDSLNGTQSVDNTKTLYVRYTQNKEVIY